MLRFPKGFEGDGELYIGVGPPEGISTFLQNRSRLCVDLGICGDLSWADSTSIERVALDLSREMDAALLELLGSDLVSDVARQYLAIWVEYHDAEEESGGVREVPFIFVACEGYYWFDVSFLEALAGPDSPLYRLLREIVTALPRMPMLPCRFEDELFEEGSGWWEERAAETEPEEDSEAFLAAYRLAKEDHQLWCKHVKRRRTAMPFKKRVDRITRLYREARSRMTDGQRQWVEAFLSLAAASLSVHVKPEEFAESEYLPLHYSFFVVWRDEGFVQEEMSAYLNDMIGNYGAPVEVLVVRDAESLERAGSFVRFLSKLQHFFTVAYNLNREGVWEGAPNGRCDQTEPVRAC